MLQDSDLLIRLNQGDADALRLIYEEYVDDLVVVAMSLLGDVHAAEDCLQDVFTRLAQHAGGVRIRRNLKGFLVCSVANGARDHLRRRARQSVELIEEQDCRTSAEDDPVTRLIEAERSARFFKAVSRLPYEQREAFVLHLRGGMKFREIAAILDISTNTAKSRYRYAVEKIRTLVGNEIENDEQG